MVDVVKLGETVKIKCVELTPKIIHPKPTQKVLVTNEYAIEWQQLFPQMATPCQADEGNGSSEGVETRR